MPLLCAAKPVLRALFVSHLNLTSAPLSQPCYWAHFKGEEPKAQGVERLS